MASNRSPVGVLQTNAACTSTSYLYASGGDFLCSLIHCSLLFNESIWKQILVKDLLVLHWAYFTFIAQLQWRTPRKTNQIARKLSLRKSEHWKKICEVKCELTAKHQSCEQNRSCLHGCQLVMADRSEEARCFIRLHQVNRISIDAAVIFDQPVFNK